jgi:MFS family permease
MYRRRKGDHMTAAVRGALPRVDGIGVGVVPLLALAIFIQYVDRGNLATAAPLMKDQLHLSTIQIGVLLSSFYWTYTPAQLLAGWLAERINAYRTLALGLGLWSLATIGSGLVSGFAMLITLRLLLGLGESAAFPCSSKLIGQHLPPHKLGAANGLIGMGLALGPAFGTFVGGMLMAQLGWRPVFILFGAVSLLWLWPWLTTTRHLSAAASLDRDESAPSFFAILRRREAWGTGLGHFANNYAFYFVISWLPLYLVKSRGFTVPQMAEIGGLVYVVYAISSMATGWICDRWMAAGASFNTVRKTAAVASHTLAAAAMMACAVGDARVALVSLFLAAIAFGFNTPTIYAIGQVLAGPRAAGKWIGVQNCAGNVAGIVAPILTAFVVDRTGQFTWAFVIAGCVALTGVVWWALVIPKVEPLNWTPAAAAGG